MITVGDVRTWWHNKLWAVQCGGTLPSNFIRQLATLFRLICEDQGIQDGGFDDVQSQVRLCTNAGVLFEAMRHTFGK